MARHARSALGAITALAITALVAPVAAVAAVAEPAPSLPAGALAELAVQYVGPVGEGEVYAAVVDRGFGIAQVYLCDGADLGLWLEGTLADGSFAVSAEDGSTATGSVDGGSARGSVILADGAELVLELPRARLPAGLYERLAVEAGELVAARTIVLPDGSAKGKRRPTGISWIDPDTEP